MDYSTIRYKKISYKKGRVYLSYSLHNEGRYSDHSMETDEEPLDTFKFAFRELEDEVLDICELPDVESELENRIVIDSVIIDYDNKNKMGCVIHFNIRREKIIGEIKIKTPHCYLEQTKDKDKDIFLLKKQTQEKIFTLIEEADKYRLGFKKQLRLLVEDEAV